MSQTVLEKLIMGYMATTQPVYSFGWQGGESTLMGLNFFRRIIDLQKKYGGDGVNVANGIQTNAALIDDKFAEHLARYRFLIGCSLDGPAPIHDRYRRTSDGGSSHESVLKGINILKRHRVELNVLVLVTQANAHRAKDVFSYLIDQGFNYHQYIPCVEFNEKGKLMPYAITGQQWGDFMCVVFDQWYSHDRNTVSIRNFDSMIQKLIDGSANICSLGDNCCQYFVVEYNGDIYPCDFFVKEDLKIGNILEMTWEDALSSKVYNDFGIQKSCHNAVCATCDCLDLCMGDCLKHRLYDDHAAQNLSWLCTGWQQVIRHARDKLKMMADDLRWKQVLAQQRTIRLKVSRPKGSLRPGRNQPCPCGSNLKFKKCCGQ
jgi:uncharacterized protein